jgi:uncharacterized protein YjbI with pentapeptide repeats
MRWLTFVCLLSALPASGQTPWTWKDGKGTVHSKAELDTILVENREWVKSNGSRGKRADLAKADLSNADLGDANLRGAILTEANLSAVDLSGADLRGAVLAGAELSGADLTQAHLSEANLTGVHAKTQVANFTGADLTNATLCIAVKHTSCNTDLSGADFTGATLNNAHLQWVNLSGAHFNGTKLEGADLENADLSGADFTGADLRGAKLLDVCFVEPCNGKALPAGQEDPGVADLSDSNLDGAAYQPSTSVDVYSMSTARYLSNLAFQNNPKPLVDLRNALRDSGYVGPEREVNEAYHRHDFNVRPGARGSAATNSPENQAATGSAAQVKDWYKLAMYWLGEAITWLQQVAFDWTCGWGANPGRPLVIIAVMALLCTPVYWIGMQFQPKGVGLFLVASGDRVRTSESRERVMRICVNPARQSVGRTMRELGPKTWIAAAWRTKKRWLWLEWRAFRTALLFSLMSVFNIGFEGFNGGEWIRMLQTREFDIRARGWMRTVSGLQSLLGVGLLALSILTYFGHPFE